jgi:hypothetical protein
MKLLLGNHRSLRMSKMVDSEPENGSLLFFGGSQKHYCHPLLSAAFMCQGDANNFIIFFVSKKFYCVIVNGDRLD